MTTYNKELGSSVIMVDEQAGLANLLTDESGNYITDESGNYIDLFFPLYAKETMSSVTKKNEQFGFDIFADDSNMDADSVAYYCDGADAMWNELAPSVIYIDHDLFVYENLSETITLADAISMLIAYKRTLPDITTMSDEFNRVVAFIRESSDSLSMSDTLTIALMTELLDSVSMSDEFIVSYSRILPDSIVMSDLSIFNSETAHEDNMAMSDIFNRVVDYARSQIDTVTMSDSPVLIVGTVLGDTTTMSDVAVLVSTNLLTNESGVYLTDESGNQIDSA